ncbi:hypothetical protein KSF73_03595 [Burkholderiaceae bacterium DAT-1]|nr:hypothetical protein [Burkholderiaceae bacterium DAT-1]
MKHWSGQSCFSIMSATALALTCIGASANPVQLDDTQLSDVHAQGMIDMSNTSYGAYDFSRITLNADVSINAVLKQLNFGQRNGGADLVIDYATLGGSGKLSISNPYIETVYEASGRQVVGFRIGAGSISGDVMMKMTTLSGNFMADAGTEGKVSTAFDANGGVRWDGSCPTGTTGCVPMSRLTGVRADNSRDFWVSFLSQSVSFAGTPVAAQSGVWMNWTERLTAYVSPAASGGASPAAAMTSSALVTNLSTAPAGVKH